MEQTEIIKKLKLLKNSAKQRNLYLDLSTNEYRALIEMGCIYCGKNLKNDGGYCLDRIDNNKGYVFNNCTPCCKICNYAKRDLSTEEFMEWIERIYTFSRKKLQEVAEYSFDKREIINSFKKTKVNFGLRFKNFPMELEHE